MIQVGTYPSRSDAEIAQGALAAAGIESIVVADDAGGAYPFDLTGGARLVVDSSDFEVAVDVLAGRDGKKRARSTAHPHG